MAEIVTPRVYLVGETRIVDSGLAAFLKETGVPDWSTDAPTDLEGLTEVMGRLCYRSFDPALNPNLTQVRHGNASYLGNVIESRHGSVVEHGVCNFIFTGVSRVFCYDAETEVLTDEGWKPWPDVRGDELFATLNPDTDEFEYQRATERFESNYDGPMYRVASEQIDLLVTPNHRMWVRKYNTQAARRGEERFGIQFAQDILGKTVEYQKTARWNLEHDELITVPPTVREWTRSDNGVRTARSYPGVSFPAREFARFLGYWLAEGILNRPQIVVFQNTGPVLADIVQTLEAMKLNAYVSDRTGKTGSTSVRTNCTPLYDFLEGCGRGEPNKRVPKIVQSWNPELIRILLEAMIDGDGSRRKDGNHSVIYTSSPGLADDIQILAIKAGWSANIRIDDRVGLERTMNSGQVFHNRHPSYIVSIIRTRTSPLVNHGGRRHDEIVHYSGTIHCVKVPNGLLWVRRNGKPVVSGNTHELVRHRAGVAVSQESLRFVRLDHIAYPVPALIEENERAMTIFARTMDELEGLQRELAQVLEVEGRPFHEKKRITSAMRRLAPDGMATAIGWSANIRTIRHVLEMRTDPAAEEEIRRVFGLVGAVMKERYPNLFQDYTVEEADGLAWYRTEYGKI